MDFGQSRPIQVSEIRQRPVESRDRCTSFRQFLPTLLDRPPIQTGSNGERCVCRQRVFSNDVIDLVER